MSPRNQQDDEKVKQLTRVIANPTETQVDEVPLSEKLWQNTADIRKKVLDSNFIKKIGNGTLDPVKFGRYVVQDAVYLYHTKVALDTLTRRTTDDYFCFFAEESESYRSYYVAMFNDWSIGEPSGIQLNRAATEYVDRLSQVAKSDLLPAYYFVAVLPCLRLWPWIGEQINHGEDSGVYKKWVQENFTGSGYIEWEKLVNQSKVDPDVAQQIYSKSMACEYKFFDSADPQ